MIRFETQDAGKLLLRLTMGVLMLLHGIGKLRHGIDGIIGDVESRGLPTFFAYGVYVGEVVAPLLIIAGWQTRIAALVFAFNMIIAVWLAHASQIFSLSKSGAWGSTRAISRRKLASKPSRSEPSLASARRKPQKVRYRRSVSISCALSGGSSPSEPM